MGPRPAAGADPLLNPLLERLAFLETVNDGLKSKLSAGGFDVEMRNLALREQLERVRAEVVRQQEALENLCRETLAAAQARDQALTAAEDSRKDREAAVQERDALRSRLETLEADLESARRGALGEDARRRIDDLVAKLEIARRSAHDAESALRDTAQKAEIDAAERVRSLAAEASSREASLLKTIADDRRVLKEMEGALETARQDSQEAENALRESKRKTDAEASDRQRMLAREFSDREASLLKTVENDRRLLATLKVELERARLSEQEAARALRESDQKAQAQAEERLQTLTKTSAEREVSILKGGEIERKRLAEMTVELERTRLRAQEAETALRESARKALQEAEFEAAERLRKLAADLAEQKNLTIAAAEIDRRRIAALELELELARRSAVDEETVLRDASRRTVEEAQAEAAERLKKAQDESDERLRALRVEAEERVRSIHAEGEERLRKLEADFAEQKKAMLESSEKEHRRVEALELELGQARRDALDAEAAYREDSRKSSEAAQVESAGRLRETQEESATQLRAAQDEASERLRALTTGFSEREAQLLKSIENDRFRVETLELKLERTRLDALEAERALRESHRIASQAAEDDAARRLRILASESSHREALLFKTAEDDRKRPAQSVEATDPMPEPMGELEPPPEAPPSAEPPLAGAAFISPSLEPVLDPGWARLLRLVRPPVESAYAHLRRLSSTALTAGQKALLRMAAASIASASDSLSSIELALEEGPAPAAPAPTAPVLESSLAAWEAAFRARGVALTREFSSPLPETAHSPKELRIALHHVLRNVLEAVPRGGRLVVRARRAPDGALHVEFTDDGPGFSAEWLARQFEPFAAPRRGRAGLGLSIVRRTLRRWGGDAEAANVKPGRGARLTLLFAPPPPPAPAVK
jgi:signal transduction histidine kinase